MHASNSIPFLGSRPPHRGHAAGPLLIAILGPPPAYQTKIWTTSSLTPWACGKSYGPNAADFTLPDLASQTATDVPLTLVQLRTFAVPLAQGLCNEIPPTFMLKPLFLAHLRGEDRRSSRRGSIGFLLFRLLSLPSEPQPEEHACHFL